MDIFFLSVVVIVFIVIVMWIVYVRILNRSIDKEENLKLQLSSEGTNTKEIQKEMVNIKWIQKVLIYQCLLFSSIILLSLIWIWRYTIRHKGDIIFNLILAVFTVSQVINFVAFWNSYRSRL